MEENPEDPIEAIQCFMGLSSKTYSKMCEEVTNPSLCIIKTPFKEFSYGTVCNSHLITMPQWFAPLDTLRCAQINLLYI